MRCWGIQGWTNLARAARLFECSMVVSISPFIWMWQANHTAFLESEFLMKCRKNRKGMERFCSTTIPTFRCLIHHAPKLATRHGSIGLHRLHAKCPKNQLSHMLHNCVDNIYIYSLLYIYIHTFKYTYDLTSTWLDYMIWYIYIYIHNNGKPDEFLRRPSHVAEKGGPQDEVLPQGLVQGRSWTNSDGFNVDWALNQQIWWFRGIFCCWFMTLNHSYWLTG